MFFAVQIEAKYGIRKGGRTKIGLFEKKNYNNFIF